MKRFVVRSVAEIIEKVEALFSSEEHVVFRGQAEQGNLLPGIAREHPMLNSVELEKAMLRQLQLQGCALLGEARSDLDCLVAAQHYGMKTRLLDWSGSMLAAAWFACSDYEKGDVYIYCLPTKGLINANVYERGPFDFRATKVFQPRLSNERVSVQDGWFTLHAYSNKSARYVSLERNAIIKTKLVELRIPAETRPAILKGLSRCGVGKRTLFPGLDGLCQHLNGTVYSHHFELMPTPAADEEEEYN